MAKPKPKLKRWLLVIESKSGETRKIPLDHEYLTEKEAEREAEDLADFHFTEQDEGWGVDEDKSMVFLVETAIENKIFKLNLEEVIAFIKEEAKEGDKIEMLKRPNS